MEDTNLENQDSSNPEGEQDTNLENESGDEVDEVAKAKELAENQKIRAEKAERELKALKAKGESETPKTAENVTQKNEKPSEVDYAKLAFLEGRKVSHPEDQKLVLAEAERLKLSLTDVLGMEYIQSKLKNANDQREAETGTPQGRGKAKGSSKGEVEYWLQKGETPDDLELANKVIDARMKQEETTNKFSDELY